MLSRELADLADLVQREGPAQGVVLEAPLQGKNHRLGHAGVSRLGREAEVQSEIHIARHAHDAALDDEHVGPFLGDLRRNIARARDIAHDRPALQVVGLNDRGYGAGHRHYQVDLRQRGVHIGAQINRRATLDLTRHLLDTRRVQVDESQAPHIGRQEFGDRRADGAASADHGSRDGGWLLAQ